MPPYESNCTALDMESNQILGLCPRLKVVESDIGKFTAELGAIHRKTDAVKPFIHLDSILSHTLADHIERKSSVYEGKLGERVAAPIVTVVVAVWMIASAVVAVRQALDYRSTARAVAVCVAGAVLSFGLMGAVALIFSQKVS